MIWQINELEWLRKHIDQSPVDIYRLYEDHFGPNRSYDSIQGKVQRLREAYDPTDLVNGVSDSDVQQTFTPIESFLSNKVPLAAKTQNTIECGEWLRELTESTKGLLVPSPREPVKSKDSSLVLSLSDLHFGQHNKDYDLVIAEERLLSIPERLYEYISCYNEIDEVVVAMIGDMVEGENIYPSQSAHLVCTCIDQSVACTEGLWKLLIELCELFSCPVRVIAVPGNHGRAGTTISERTNWDNVVYHNLKILSRAIQDKQITIDCDFEPFRTFLVKGHKGLIYHQGVKHAGTPAMREKIATWLTTKNCDFLMHGHFHDWKIETWNDRLVISNGSMCGPNDYSEEIARETPARQGYFLATKGRPLHDFGFMEWRHTIDEVSPN